MSTAHISATSSNTLRLSMESAKRPPLDGTLTIDQLYDWHRVNSADLPCLIWAHNNSHREHMSWKELGLGVDTTASLIKKQISAAVSPEFPYVNGPGLENPTVVGILSTADAVTYSTFLLAMQRLTHPTHKTSGGLATPLLPFPISTRNSPAATAHLIRKVNVRYIYVSDGPMRKLLDEALSFIDEAHRLNVKIIPMPSFSDLYPAGPHPSNYDASTVDFTPVRMDSPAIIMHSSGSTSFPKPITLTHRTLLEYGCSFQYGGMKTKGDVMAVHASPLFHSMALLALSWSPISLFPRAVSSPYLNVPPPTPEYFLSQVVASGSTMLYCVPSFLEAWADDPSSLQILQTLKAVIYAGAPLSEKTGTFLHNKGVKIHCLLGATEFGQVSTMPPNPHPEGYDWFELSSFTDPHLDPQGEDNLYELMFKRAPGHHPSVINAEVDGVPTYASNDLLEQHPMNKKLWRVVGRKDDQLMLSTGEKTNPGPLEDIIRRNKDVRGVVFFGRGRLQNGIIIEPVSWAKFPTGESFRDAVWPDVEEANAFAPSHSRIFKEMVLVASLSKPFSYTPKGPPRRGAIVKEYEPEIEALYAAVKESSQLDIPAPSTTSREGGWSVDDSVAFVRQIVVRVMKEVPTLGEDDDLFEAGCTSLEATYIRNSVLRALRESVPASQVHKLPSNFVYQHPSIRQLGIYAAQASGRAGQANGHAINPEEARAKRMDDMVHKYTQNFPTHRASSRVSTPSSGEVILLTGSTGGLGSQILARLVTLPSVSKIYAFNRANKAGISSRDRQREAFLDRGNDLAALDSEKIVFVEGDTSVEGLGITDGLRNEIRDSVTAIIHNAWQVDFKMLLPSFEPAIRGVRNLVDLALGSPHPKPPSLLFTSSIGILRNWRPNKVPEAPVTDPNLIMNIGYGESKWVSERVLLEAAAATPLKPVIIRVGQLSGGLNGCWNVHEWFPSLVGGSQVLGCLPDSAGLVSWIPLHSAAAALVDLRNASLQVAHLVHPRPISWTLLARHISEILGPNVPLVPWATWISRLQSVASQSPEDISGNPALRLFEFYAASQSPSGGSDLDSREAIGLANLETKNTEREAPSLGPEVLPQLGKEESMRWLSYWKSKGLVKF